MNDVDPLLTIDDLHVSYGPIKALRGISLEVPRGKVVAILGSNGAGKTTLLKTVSGLLAPDEGSIVFDGENIAATPAERIAIKGVLHAPEGRQVFTDLTVEENLRIGAFTLKGGEIPVSTVNEKAVPGRLQSVYDAWRKDTANDEPVRLSDKETYRNNLARVYALFPVLEERKKQIAATLSGGEMQMLAIARALMGTPKLLILDEPSLGLAPLIVKGIFETIKELNRMGISILIVEQNALQTLKIADYAYVLQVGQTVRQGRAEELIKDEELVKAYLGK